MRESAVDPGTRGWFVCRTPAAGARAAWALMRIPRNWVSLHTSWPRAPPLYMSNETHHRDSQGTGREREREREIVIQRKGENEKVREREREREKDNRVE